MGKTSYITVDNCKVSETNVGGSLTTYNPGHIRIGYGGFGTQITIKNCELTGEYSGGIKIYSMGGYIFTNITIENNFIHDVHTGIAFKWGDDVNKNFIVRNNIIQNGIHRGIYCDQSYVIIQNNIIANFPTAIKFGDNWGGSYTNVSHNTIYGSTNNALYFAYGSNNTIRDNILYSTSKIADYASNNSLVNNLLTDPQFVDESKMNLHLLPESNAIGNATDGKDIGADVDSVGINVTSENPSELSSPTGLKIIDET